MIDSFIASNLVKLLRLPGIRNDGYYFCNTPPVCRMVGKCGGFGIGLVPFGGVCQYRVLDGVVMP